MQTSTLRPGRLISLNTSLQGNRQYHRYGVEREQTEDGSERTVWETERTIADLAEYEAALRIRSKASALIRGRCVKSVFGLLCPESSVEVLDQAITEAQQLVKEFNTGAKLTRVFVYVLAGRIAADDVEAIRAINSEVRDLLDRMDEGLRNLDAPTVRKAATKLRNVERMLAADVRAPVQAVIDAARTSASKMVKAGEQAAIEIDQTTLRRLAEARTAFLDLDETAAEIVAPAAEARAVDLEPTPEIKSAPLPRAALEFE